MNTTPCGVAFYLRVSTDGQTAENQRRDLGVTGGMDGNLEGREAARRGHVGRAEDQNRR